MKSNQLIWLISIINSLLIIPVCNAQNRSETILEDIFEDLSVNNRVEESDWEEELEELALYRQEPINLNAATRSQLEQFPFLNDWQVENLLAYIYIHGQMKSIYELQLVEGMDRQTIRLLLPFVRVEDINNEDTFQWKSLLRNAGKYGRHELLTRFDIPFYRREGYKHTYLGTPVYNSLRYGFRYGDRLYAELTAENDAGEPWGALHNRAGYDYYSFYLLLKDCGWLKRLAVGNYRLSFGQGLVVSNDFLMGKNLYASSFSTEGRGIRRHASTDELNYFRGVAATVSLSKRWDVSGFYSHRQMDGVIEDGEITSIYRTGLHRSRREADKKHRFALQAAGGNVSYQQNRIRLGITGIYYVFNRPYEPKLTGYSQYNLYGKSFYNIGVNYGYRLGRLSVQGETAKGSRGWASLNRLNWSLGSSTRLMLVQRFYSYDYWAMFARAFGEGSRVQNEQGCYLGVETAPFRRWSLLASVDLFSFPWKRYRVSKTYSKGMDGLLQATFTPVEQWSMYLRYRYKQKERDLTGSGGKVILPTYHHQLRYRLNGSLGECWSVRTTLDGNRFHSRGMEKQFGWQATQMIACRIPRARLTAQLQGSYFDTDTYDSRVYISEKGLLYTFYTPSFQGRGCRLSAHLRYDLNEHWMCIAKLGHTVYADRNEIGSGNDLIQGNRKTDLQVQVRVKF